jgi:YD repeat-containing protein
LSEDNDEDERGHFSLKELLEKLYAKLHKKNQKRNKVTKYSYNSFGQLKTVTLPDETQIEYILSAVEADIKTQYFEL